MRGRRKQIWLRLEEWGAWAAQPIHALGYPAEPLELARHRDSLTPKAPRTKRVAKWARHIGDRVVRPITPWYWPRRNPRAVDVVIASAPEELRIIARLRFVEGKTPTRIAEGLAVDAMDVSRWLNQLVDYVDERIR